MIAPGLYLGKVMHRRLAAPPHKFSYGCFWIAVDLDAPPRLRLFSVDRPNLFALLTRDHADGLAGDLRAKIAGGVERAGDSKRDNRHCERSEAIQASDALLHSENNDGGRGLRQSLDLGSPPDLSGRMILLTMPRLFGFVFNPLSVYFCHDANGAPSAVAWEVSNTFGARHTYVIPIDETDDGVVRQTCDKRLHVSPFLDMGLSYQFRVETSADALKIGILDRGREGPALAAALTASRRDLTDAALLALALRAPLATLKIIAAIHWEALRLWLKGAKFRRAPPNSERPIADHAISHHLRAEAKRRPMNAVSDAAE